MRLDPILTRASRRARSGKYDEVIKTLQPEINRYHNSFRYYYLLGASCLHAGDHGAALDYLRIAHEIKENDPLPILGLAALHLRRSQNRSTEISRAVDCYLKVLELDPKNRVANKALKLIKKHSVADTFSAWIEAGHLPSLYPHIPSPGLSGKEIFAAIAIPLAACVAILIILARLNIISFPADQSGAREGAVVSSLTQEDRDAPVQTGGTYRYILTRNQAIETYERALSLFSSYRDEAARVQLNRILESNAADNLKNKAKLILSYMDVPGFDNFKRNDNFSYTEAARDPFLYNGVHVIWQGMATGVETTGEGTTFKLLVNYDTRRTLDGVVNVKFSHAIQVSTEHPLEVLGSIHPALIDGPIQMNGVAVYQSGLPIN